MHALLLLLIVLILALFLFSHRKQRVVLLPGPGQEMYKNEPSEIQFPNAEFKFYK